ncbi:FkbM family methyltransferase [Pedobacter sp. HDW13]|uniref:FkbM family methyltransferase n=1 Tax=Pedobacter sp. HDW13 TaxID=2714940 RepID=UPI00140B6C8A|nr:FkbM family methyltransferase [Pedobacter sp. HDW13]QIL40661.1 FkbM family methyltransferase [Pedobacter sp. HDW13]
MIGNFKIECDPTTWIGSKIVYTGDYEASLKQVFSSYIAKNDYVLDIGANIGFHTLYFAELVGQSGKVTAFEPIPFNYSALIRNISLNNFPQITPQNIALSNKNETFKITADAASNNPGSFNLFEKNGDVTVDCKIGDEFLIDEKINFIKIDVEGYEAFVIAGLMRSITKNLPYLVFEYDQDYHLKTGFEPNYIFNLLKPLGYQFYLIKRTEQTVINNLVQLLSGNILAKPPKK